MAHGLQGQREDGVKAEPGRRPSHRLTLSVEVLPLVQTPPFSIHLPFLPHSRTVGFLVGVGWSGGGVGWRWGELGWGGVEWGWLG